MNTIKQQMLASIDKQVAEEAYMKPDPANTFVLAPLTAEQLQHVRSFVASFYPDTQLPNTKDEALEQLIDTHGLNEVLETIAGICHEKADHIRSSYHDQIGADSWDLASTNCMVASEFAFHHPLTIRSKS